MADRDGDHSRTIVPPPDDPLARYRELAIGLHREAESLYTQKRYSEAESAVRQLLALEQQVVGPRHADFALGLCMLGELRFLQGDCTEAESSFRQALVIRAETVGQGHPDYASALGCLAGVIWRRGALEEAESLLRAALAIRRQVLGERHPDTIIYRKELARLLRRRGDWAGAHELVRFRPAATGPSAAYRSEPVSNGLTRDVVTMSAAFSGLSEDLALAAERMSSVGEPPLELFASEVFAAQQEFAVLRDFARRLAANLRMTCPPLETLETLQDVAALLDDVAETEFARDGREDARRRALTLLDRVQAIGLVSGRELAPLRECQERARALRVVIARNHWSKLPSQTEPLAAGDHALAYLLILVEKLDALTDREWASLHEAVGSLLGKPLASAASRAQLRVGVIPHFPDETSPTPATPAPIKPTPMALDVRGEPSISEPDQLALARDMAVASLVPTMGQIINLPSDSSTEPTPHRLWRVGSAPEVAMAAPAEAAPTAAPVSRPAPAPRPIVSGPLPLVQSSWNALEAKPAEVPGATLSLTVTDRILRVRPFPAEPRRT